MFWAETAKPRTEAAAADPQHMALVVRRIDCSQDPQQRPRPLLQPFQNTEHQQLGAGAARQRTISLPPPRPVTPLGFAHLSSSASLFSRCLHRSASDTLRVTRQAGRTRRTSPWPPWSAPLWPFGEPRTAPLSSTLFHFPTTLLTFSGNENESEIVGLLSVHPSDGRGRKASLHTLGCDRRVAV